MLKLTQNKTLRTMAISRKAYIIPRRRKFINFINTIKENYAVTIKKLFVISLWLNGINAINTMFLVKSEASLQSVFFKVIGLKLQF